MQTKLAAGGFVLPPGLHVSFQRYARPPDDAIANAPSSLGALPVAFAASGELALPVAPNEAFWIGLETMQPGARAEIAVQFRSPGEGVIDALSGVAWSDEHPTWLTIQIYRSIEGIALATGGFRSFARPRLARGGNARSLLVFVTRAGETSDESRTTRVVLVDYARFETMTGRPAPALLDPAAQYRGWLLP